MVKSNRKQIQQAARDLLAAHPEGLRWSELHKSIVSGAPDTPGNSVTGALTTLFQNAPDITKVARGTYQLTRYAEAQSAVPTGGETGGMGVSNEPLIVETPGHARVALLEADFYASFAEWLQGADEVTAAVALGGSVLKGKWGTPDVLGVLRSRTQDILKFEPQIVSAEIKLDPNQPVVAFGQAIAYRLFSHKSYIVVPDSTSADDIGRLKALCSIHGVGLVTFALDPAQPDYSIVVLPLQASPDMFYANQMLRRLLDAQPVLFNALFG